MADDQIDVKLGATDEGLKAGMEGAAADTKASTDAMSAAFTQMADIISSSMLKTSAAIVESLEKSKAKMHEQEVEADTFGAKMKEAFAKTHESLEGFATSINKVHKLMGLFAEVVGIGFVGEQIVELARKFAEYGEQVEFSGARAGISAQEMQKLNYAAETVGLSAQTAELAMTRLARAMVTAQQGSTQTIDAFKSLGLSAADLSHMTLEETLNKVADAFSKHADGANKAAVAQQLFGRGGAQLIPLLNKGSEGLDQLRQHAEQLGIVLDEKDIEAASHLQKSLVDLDAQTRTLGLRLGAELVPAFSSVAAAMTSVSSKGGPLQQLFTGLGDVIKAVVSVGISFVGVFNEVAEAIATVAVVADLAAHGQFTAAAAAVKIGIENIKKTADETDASLKKMWADTKPPEGGGPAEGDQSSKPALPVFSTENMGRAATLAAAILAMKQAALKADYSLTKAHLDEQQKLDDDAYANGLLSAKQYYDAKLALTQADLNAQIGLKRSEISAAQKNLGAAQANSGRPGGEEAVVKARTQLISLTGQLNVLEDRLTNASVENAAKREDAERKLNDTLQKGTIDTQEKIADDSIATQKALAESRYSMGLMTKDQLLQIEQQLEDQKYQIARDAIQKRLALEDTATYKNPTAIAQLNNQLLQLDAQYNASVIQNQAKLQEALAAPYTTMIDGVKNQFETGIADMLNGTKTFSQGLSAILVGVVQAFDKMIAQMLVRWIQSELTKTTTTTAAVGARTSVEVGSIASTTAAHALGTAAQVSTTVSAEGAKTGAVVAGNAFRTASDWEAALESTAATAWAAVKNIATKAWEAAASVYSAIAAIPYVGPFLAPAMALAAVGTVIAFAGNVASAEGGYDIPSGVNPVTQLHEQEMVLPKAQADVIRRMANQGIAQGAQAQGDTHVHIHAVDAASFEKRLAQAGGTLQSMIRQAHRDGKGGQLRNTWGATG